MPLFICTLATTLVVLTADAIVITLLMRPLFKAVLGDQMLDVLRLGPAALFYLVHIAGIVRFAGLPAMRNGIPAEALVNGALLGLVAYSCYEMTSWTIMRDWTVLLVVVDIAWGMLMSGLAGWTGTKVALALRRETA